MLRADSNNLRGSNFQYINLSIINLNPLVCETMDRVVFLVLNDAVNVVKIYNEAAVLHCFDPLNQPK